jgi:uncharacterized protein YjdB
MKATPLTRSIAILTAFSGVMACQDTSGPRVPSPPGTESVSIVPRSATIEAGGTVAFKATLSDEFGDPLAATFEWRSSDDAVATVTAQGEVRGRSEGRAVITASAHGKSQLATVQVLGRAPKDGGKETDPLLARRPSR